MSNREPYLHTRRPDGTIGWAAATGGVAVALDALMRERGGIWIAHGAGSRRPRRGRRARQAARTARHAVVRAAAAVAARRAVRVVLRRLRQRGAVAAVPSGRRAPAIPAARTGRHTRPSTNALRRRSTRSWRARRRRCSSRTTTSRSWPRACASAGQPCAPPSSGTSRGRTRIVCASVPGVASCSAGPARERPARVSARARSPQLPAGGRARSWAPTSRRMAPASVTGTRRPRVVAVPIGVDYDRIQSRRRDAGLAARAAAAASQAFGLEAPILGRRSRSARLHEGDSGAARRARSGADRAARPARTASRSCRSACPRARSSRATARSSPRSTRRSPTLNARHCIAGRPPPVYYPQGGTQLPSSGRAVSVSRTSASSARCTTG